MVPLASGDSLDYLLQQGARRKVAFLPFGLLIDKWRWEVFSGQVKPEEYNKAWWDLRLKYQGVAPPMARTEADFDPGAKYRVPWNVPYMLRYLPGARAAVSVSAGVVPRSRIFGTTAPLLDLWKQKVAGQRLNEMLALGASKPWQEALETLTGEKQMDATAIADYLPRR